MKRSIDELRDDLARKAREIRETERHLRSTVSLNHRQIALLGHALRHPGTRYSIESHKVSHGITYQTARTDLLTLEAKGLLVRSKKGRAFSFAAHEDLETRLRALTA